MKTDPSLRSFFVRLHPWKFMAKMAIDHAKNRGYYLYSTYETFLGYDEKLTRKEQLKLKAHLIYKPTNG